MSVLLLVCAMIGCLNIKKVEIQAATAHVVTFDYNVDDIIDYIPSENATLMNKLKTYSITVDNGGYAVETSTPGTLISPYYTYNWTVNGSVVNLNNFSLFNKEHDVKANVYNF